MIYPLYVVVGAPSFWLAEPTNSALDIIPVFPGPFPTVPLLPPWVPVVVVVEPGIENVSNSYKSTFQESVEVSKVVEWNRKTPPLVPDEIWVGSWYLVYGVGYIILVAVPSLL